MKKIYVCKKHLLDLGSSAEGEPISRYQKRFCQIDGCRIAAEYEIEVEKDFPQKALFKRT